MTAQILDGKATAATIKSELREIVSGMARKPGLGTILVGDDPGSHSYVGGKHKDCAEVGITSIRVDLPASASQAEIGKTGIHKVVETALPAQYVGLEARLKWSCGKPCFRSGLGVRQPAEQLKEKT